MLSGLCDLAGRVALGFKPGHGGRATEAAPQRPETS
jgi:hypothetical protein